MRNIRAKLVTGAAVGAAMIGGAAIANAATSSTSSTSSTPSTSSTAPGARQSAPPSNMPAHGTAAHENAEKTVTGAAAAKAQAAAVKSVGSGTAGAVTTDYTGNGYEVTVTKADGSQVEIHLDSSFAVMQGPGGMGGSGRMGAPSGAGAPGGYGG
jgi:nicotinic acid phosphoribosyltransferase